MAEQQDSIQIKDIGPIAGPLTIPLHPDGGVTVLVGPNGAGKDEAIKAIRHGLGGKEKLSRRDGTKAGTLQMPGVSMRITSSIRRKGEAEVVALDGDLNYAEFVNPQVKDPAAADRARVRLLCRLHRVIPERSKFYPLFEGDYDDVVGPEQAFLEVASAKTIEATDLDAMAQSLAADLHRRKRQLQDQAKQESGQALACDEAVAEVDLEAPHDSEALQETYDELHRRVEQLWEQKRQWESAQQRQDNARRNLTEAREGYKGPTAEEASIALEEAEERHEKATQEVDRLRAQLQQAERTAEATLSAATLAEARYNSACEHERLVEQCEKAIESTGDVPCPTDEQLEQAIAERKEAHEAVERGAVIREAIKKQGQAQIHRERSQALAEQAEQCETQAKSVLEVLANSIGTGVLYIDEDENDNPRFMFDHPKRGATYYHDLSDGEKWVIAMLDAVMHIRGDGQEGLALFPIEQRAWEGLDVKNKTLVAREAMRHKINVVTAQSLQELPDDGADGIEILRFVPAPEEQDAA